MEKVTLSQLPTSGALLRRHFFAGLLVVIPLGVIAWILGIVLSSLWSLPLLLPDAIRPETLVGDETGAWLLHLLLTIGVAVVLAIGVSIMGWLSHQFLGQKVLEFIADGLIQRIPVVRSIYSALDQLLRTMAAGGGQQFNRVVYIEYPRKGIWTLAFVTGPARTTVLPPGHLNVYVPTTPNPTSGFYLLVHESEVRESQMRVEDAFKTILSLGIAQGGALPAHGSRGPSNVG